MKSSCFELECVPTPTCAKVLTQAGLLTRKTANGISVFYDEQRVDALQLCATDAVEPLSLGFKVVSKDPFSSNYTEPGQRKDDTILYFDTRGAKPDKATGKLRLHKGEYVGERESDFKELGSPALEDFLSKRDRLVRPLCLVNIYPFVQNQGSVSEQLNASPKDYYLKFKARKTFWKYYLLGTMSKPNAGLEDLNKQNNKMAFEKASETLPDGQTAITFRSKQTISLQEQSECHFQLREKGERNGRVLIKRLPVASAAHITREQLNGETVLISEIYINC